MFESYFNILSDLDTQGIMLKLLLLSMLTVHCKDVTQHIPNVTQARWCSKLQILPWSWPDQMVIVLLLQWLVKVEHHITGIWYTLWTMGLHSLCIEDCGHGTESLTESQGGTVGLIKHRGTKVSDQLPVWNTHTPKVLLGVVWAHAVWMCTDALWDVLLVCIGSPLRTVSDAFMEARTHSTHAIRSGLGRRGGHQGSLFARAGVRCAASSCLAHLIISTEIVALCFFEEV